MTVTLTFFSAAEGAVCSRPLLDRLDNFSPLPAMAKSVFCNSLLCLLLIHHQNPPNEARRTTTIGTTIAGIRVARLLSEPLSDAVDVAAASLVVLEEVSAARDAASAETMEAYSAELVTGYSPVEVLMLATPATVVSTV